MDRTMVVAKIIIDCCSVYGTMFYIVLYWLIWNKPHGSDSLIQGSVINDLANKDKKYNFYDIV